MCPMVRQMVVPYIKVIPSYLAQLFGLGLQADSHRRKILSENVDCALAGFQENAFRRRRLALESTLPPHNDGAARRVSKGIESCLQPQGEFL